MGREWLRAVAMAVAVLVAGPIRLSADESDQREMARLASGDESQIEAAVAALVARYDPLHYTLLQGLFTGEVYRWEEHLAQSGLVIIGEEEMDEYGDSIVPLFTVYPQREPILAEGGAPVKISLYDLEEVETGRVIRALIQPYLLQVELFHPDRSKRLIAAENIGNKGNAEAVPVLRQAIEQEQDASIRRVKRVSLAKLLLGDADPEVRLWAIAELEDLWSPLAIPVLKERLTPEVESDPEVRAQAALALRSLQRFSSFMQVVQTAFIGLSLGSILVLMSLGLAIIYGQMGVINMAHGEFMMIGAYTTFVVQELCLTLLPPAYSDFFFAFSFPLAFLVAASFGLVLEALVIRRLYSRPLESLLATWGISLILVQAARSIFGDLTAVRLPKILSGGWELAPQIILPYNRMFIMALAVIVVGGLLTLFFRTRFGLRLRATTQNREMSACVGVPVRRVDSLAFALGTGIAGIAGWAMTLVGNVVPNMGQTYIVDSFLVVVTGGVGKLMGTISAGLGIGIFNKVLEPVFEAVYGKVILLGLIVFFLQSRPTGLFPAKGRSEEL
ncbi:MAG: urea ABC transporter permease subunit UrtB [Gemmatimonadetes bacterium]|nr:urea ABC transporter permease subunit UrtB [Gemmatimonadota bacterium]